MRRLALLVLLSLIGCQHEKPSPLPQRQSQALPNGAPICWYALDGGVATDTCKSTDGKFLIVSADVVKANDCHKVYTSDVRNNSVGYQLYRCTMDVEVDDK